MILRVTAVVNWFKEHTATMLIYLKKLYNKRLNSDVNPHGALQNISSLWENVLLVKRRLESGRLKERKQLH